MSRCHSERTIEEYSTRALKLREESLLEEEKNLDEKSRLYALSKDISPHNSFEEKNYKIKQ